MLASRATLALLCSLTASAVAQNFGLERVGSWNSDPGDFADVWGEGDLAFLGKFGHPRVLIVDVSDPTAPTLLARYDVPPPNDAASAQDVKAGDGLLFIGLEADNNAGAQIVDIRDPTNPTHLVDISINADTHNVFFADGWLYLADSRNNRFGVLDLRDFDPDNPPSTITTPTWWVNNVGNTFVHDITVQGDRLYASGWDGIYIYDVSDNANRAPRFLGSAPGQSTHSAWATPDGRFVVTAEERTDGGIKLYEVTPKGDTVTVTLRDEYAIAGRTAHNPVMLGERVFCSWYSLGCLAFTIDRNAGSFELVAQYDTGSAWGVYPLLGTDRILTSGFSQGLVILSFCEPDLDSDGDLDADDFFAYLDLFAADDPLADINGDGTIDSDDFFGFLDMFVEGC